MQRGERILLVDDSVAARKPLAETLSAGGYDVSEASEGIEGLYKARSTSFDLIITDIHMPAMDGLSLLRELRKLDEYQRTPIIVLTSDVTKERLQQVRDAGGSALLQKPPHLDTIVAFVRSTIERSLGISGD